MNMFNQSVAYLKASDYNTVVELLYNLSAVCWVEIQFYLKENAMLDTEYIEIEELPIGCVIYDKTRNTTVVIGAKKDAEAVIESLQRLIKCWYEEK